MLAVKKAFALGRKAGLANGAKPLEKDGRVK